jgi:aerobic C4-dicarboxylate transport protein
VGLFYAAIAIFVVVIFGAVMRLAGLNNLKFLAHLGDGLTIVLATASSDAVLPAIMLKLEVMSINKSVVGLVAPTGYSFNLDAFWIDLTLAVVFITQATNTPLLIGDLLLVLGISLPTSKGTHGVPGSAIVILAAADHSRHRPGPRPVGRLVHRHGARRQQSDRQLRRHGTDRGVGRGPRQ